MSTPHSLAGRVALVTGGASGLGRGAAEAAWLELEALVRRERGGLDVAILAAGIGGPMAPLAQMELSAWRKLMAVNLDGTMLGVRTAFRLMDGRGGSIITVASVNGVRCSPTMSAYAASKAGVRVVTRVAALEGAAMTPVVRVNCILPGPMDTPLLDWLRHNAPLGPERTQELLIDCVPLKRLGRPDDFAKLACFLASDASSFITGAEVPLDGGLLAG